MNKNEKILKAMLPSAILVLAGIALALLGIGLKFQASAGDMINLSGLYLSMLAVIITSFVFAAVRYNLATGLVLGLLSLHDQLLTFALVSILSIILPQADIMPTMVIFSIVFTFAQNLPVIREIRDLRHANSIRDMSNEMVVDMAVKRTGGLRMASAILAALFIAAGLISGNSKFMYTLSPLVIGLLVSIYSSSVLTSTLWHTFSPRYSKKK